MPDPHPWQDARADLEQPTDDPEKMRPLHLAAQVGNIDGVKILLQEGADVAAANAQGVTAANLALDHSLELRHLLYGALKATALDGRLFPSVELAEAAASGKLDHVKLALRAGADPNSSDGSYTALQHACLGGFTEIAMLLIEKARPHLRPRSALSRCTPCLCPAHECASQPHLRSFLRPRLISRVRVPLVSISVSPSTCARPVPSLKA